MHQKNENIFWLSRYEFVLNLFISNFRKESANIVRTVFNKSNLNFLRNLFNKNGKSRDYWTLARRMSENDTFTHHTEREEFLLQKGAFENDVYSMCELARYLFNSNDNRLPQALSWWHKAVKQHDDGATYDIQNLPIEERIKSYKTQNSEYADVEMKCAMLTEYYLTDLGLKDWFCMSDQERIARCEKLMLEVSMVLGILAPKLVFEDEPRIENGPVADGLAYPNEWLLKVRTALFNDYERLIQVLFHEIGHFIVFSMWAESMREDYLELREKYGITEQRASSWFNNEKNPNNDNTPAIEEDPDTLSYGVWMTWCIYFKY